MYSGIADLFDEEESSDDSITEEEESSDNSNSREGLIELLIEYNIDDNLLLDNFDEIIPSDGIIDNVEVECDKGE